MLCLFRPSSLAMHILLSEEEERMLYRLREDLFHVDWTSPAFKTMVRDEVPSEVYTEDGGFKIFLGNHTHALDLPLLEERGIRFVLNMACSDPVCFGDQELYGEHFKCMRVSAGDMPYYDMTQHFRATNEFIETARKEGVSILVHCVAGSSRSAAIVIAYLMQVHHWSLEKTAKHVHSKRARVYPNVGFLNQLLQLEKQLERELEESGRQLAT